MPKLTRAVPAEIFPATAERLASWEADADVIGVLLVGSKSVGHQDERSDDDLEVLLTDEAFQRLAPGDCHTMHIEGEGSMRQIVYDAQLTAMSALERKPGSSLDLDHWPYERARVLFARDPERVEAAVKAAALMTPEFRSARLAHGTIDAWVSAHRAVKTMERGFQAAGTLLVARSAKALTRVLFAMESRWAPLDHWLERELETLDDPLRIGPRIVTALKERRPAPLLEALTALENRLASEGVARAADRRGMFLELIHASRADERARHTLP
ncbi:MAG TPA: hypothetical protein VFQ05_05205 [Candidatus Eisenbacteria bacterium]|nr:hypothetical protein [Candidatus Eisenbacteria bacterium]